MLDIMYEVPKDDNIGQVVITKEYIEGNGGPKIIMRGQDYYLPALILEGVYNFTDNISTGISGIYYPYGFMNGVDSHHLRNIEFYDYVRAVMGVKAGLFFNLSFSGNKNRMFYNIICFCEGNIYIV